MERQHIITINKIKLISYMYLFEKSNTALDEIKIFYKSGTVAEKGDFIYFHPIAMGLVDQYNKLFIVDISTLEREYGNDFAMRFKTNSINNTPNWSCDINELVIFRSSIKGNKFNYFNMGINDIQDERFQKFRLEHRNDQKLKLRNISA